MGFPDYPFAPQRLEVRPGIAMSYLDEGARSYAGDVERVAFLFKRYAELTSLLPVNPAPSDAEPQPSIDKGLSP